MDSAFGEALNRLTKLLEKSLERESISRQEALEIGENNDQLMEHLQWIARYLYDVPDRNNGKPENEQLREAWGHAQIIRDKLQEWGCTPD